MLGATGADVERAAAVADAVATARDFVNTASSHLYPEVFANAAAKAAAWSPARWLETRRSHTSAGTWWSRSGRGPSSAASSVGASVPSAVVSSVISVSAPAMAQPRGASSASLQNPGRAPVV